jgi:hypothetical protein
MNFDLQAACGAEDKIQKVRSYTISNVRVIAATNKNPQID